MIKPSSKNINILALIISVIVFSLLNMAYYFWINNTKMKFNVSINYTEPQETSINKEQMKNPQIVTIEESKEETKQISPYWSIEIPEINLLAEINEGTSTEVMNKYVGHFENTQLEYGNIGLAAHNRGYPVNYFQNIKKLKEGSEILYKHGDFNIIYEVKKIEIIKNTDWSYLEKTEDNRITLITCVENEPTYRRCIQGIEKVESEEY